MSRGPRKLRGAHLESRRLSNLICLWLKETYLHTNGLPLVVLSSAVAAKNQTIKQIQLYCSETPASCRTGRVRNDISKTNGKVKCDDEGNLNTAN